MSTMSQSKNILLMLRYRTNLNRNKFISMTSAKYQERLKENKILRKQLPIDDRPQTDDLLLSPERPQVKEKSQHILEPNLEKQFIKTTPDTSAKELQNVDISGSSKLIAEQIRSQEKAAMKWEPEHCVTIDEVPGPTPLRILSTVTKALPVIGMQIVSSLMHGLNHFMLSYGNPILFSPSAIKPFSRIFDYYGNVVCFHIPFCGDIVLIHRPEHISAIYKQKSLNKITYSNFDCLSEWHKRQAKRRFDVGLGLTPEMKEFSKEKYDTNKIFWSSSKYHSSIEKTSDDLVSRIYTIRNLHNEVSEDFLKELQIWGIECMMQTLFGTNLGFYKTSDFQANIEAQRTLQSFIDASEALVKCESGLQLWRLYDTRSWNKLTGSCESLESILAKHIRMSKLRLDIALKMMIDKKEFKDTAQVIKSSLVKALILSGCVQPDQILTLCLDMLLLGVNAASTSLGFIFYHLSKSKTKQERLFNEIFHVLPQKNSVLQLEHLQETPFLHACVTESLRLKHPIPYSCTRLNQNIVIDQYYIPSGTYVMTANEVSCLKEENFDDAEKFRPERWLNQDKGDLKDAVIPLSEGTRTFLGRDWLHQQLAVATAKVIRNFNLDYRYGEIKTNRKILARPDKPFKFTFSERLA